MMLKFDSLDNLMIWLLTRITFKMNEIQNITREQ